MDRAGSDSPKLLSWTIPHSTSVLGESELARSSCVYTIQGNVDFNVNVVGNDQGGFNELDCSF